MPRSFLFPMTRFVGESGIVRQLLHVASEFLEVVTALLRRDYAHAAHECYDMIGSVETLIHKLYRRAYASDRTFHPAVVRDAVETKNRRRGYYA